MQSFCLLWNSGTNQLYLHLNIFNYLFGKRNQGQKQHIHKEKQEYFIFSHCFQCASKCNSLRAKQNCRFTSARPVAQKILWKVSQMCDVYLCKDANVKSLRRLRVVDSSLSGLPNALWFNGF